MLQALASGSKSSRLAGRLAHLSTLNRCESKAPWPEVDAENLWVFPVDPQDCGQRQRSRQSLPIDPNHEIRVSARRDVRPKFFNELVRPMFRRKSKPVPLAPAQAPRHSFKMRTKDTEIEATGFGLVVAMMAVFLVIMLGFSVVMAPMIERIAEQSAQAEPAAPVKPPAS